MAMDEWAELRDELTANPATREALEQRRPQYELARQMIALRVGLGFTQQEMAELAGMSQPMISRLEAGEIAPKWDTLARVLAAVSATVEVKAKDRRGKVVRVTLTPALWPPRQPRRRAAAPRTISSRAAHANASI